MLLPDMCDNFMDRFGVSGKSKHNELAVVGWLVGWVGLVGLGWLG